MTRTPKPKLSGPEPDDILIGELVRMIGFAGVGVVESMTAEHAVVAWDRDRRDVCSLGQLRRACDKDGDHLDIRAGE